MTEEQLAAVDTQEQARTPGEWVYVEGLAFKHYVCGGVYEHEGHKYDELRLSIQEMHPIDGHETRAAADCQFIAACTHPETGRAALADEVRRLREQLQAVTDQRDRALEVVGAAQDLIAAVDCGPDGAEVVARIKLRSALAAGIVCLEEKE